MTKNGIATKADIKRFEKSTKSDINNLAKSTKADIKRLEGKFDEMKKDNLLMKVEIMSELKEMREEHDTHH